MLSLQYLNKRLKKSHIEKILANYNIKYTTMKKEIENKINIMIKTFTEDISAFLNNMEEIAEQKQQIKNIESNQNELESLREQAKENNQERNKLKREIEILRIEINRLKSSSTGNNNNNNNNNNSTTNSSRKKINFTPYSPSSKDISYQGLNTISNFHNITSPIRKSKDTSSLLLKTERKEKKEIKEIKENKDSRIFKSPQVTQIKKTKKKISDLNPKENSNNLIKTNIRKREINKTHKNALSYSTSEVITEPNKNEKNPTYSSAYKNKKLNNKINNKEKLNKKNSSKLVKKEDKNNKNTTFIQSDTQVNKKIDALKKNERDTLPKENEEYSSEKENNTDNEDDNNESKSKITTEDNEEEVTMIDEEISEMKLLEEQILSLMGQLKEFKQQNNDLT